MGQTNSNKILLLTKCVEHDLIITNTMFHQKNKYKTSWEYPQFKEWHLIDYIIVHARDHEDVYIAKAKTDADDCWTESPYPLHHFHQACTKMRNAEEISQTEDQHRES